MSSRKAPEDRRDEILTAAMKAFGHYGYRRTSMELIAQAAGVSRPALYQHFSGKEDVFRAMGARMLDEVLDAARGAADAPGTLVDRLYAVLSIKLAVVVGSVDAGHRTELLNEAGVIAADLLVSFKDRFATLIEDLLAGAPGELNHLRKVMSAHDCAGLLLDTVVGISQADAPPEVLHRRLHQMVELTVFGLGLEPMATAAP
ncbi:HTH-type transcriptional regulator MtrR [Actinomadura rubteroloni]|uniref:HTH-type transcriptional regulator MtrR n=1 Tax=Actinomadura rubteroloni TaxID=1926885 RepID=A0A2P4UHL2_9ACTN|nr:TetR/AcrR family transcriptional regulator [Actinomadura rubteroloni]POM24533.1 HTH-type transcriptional regulator MtrR [Actinomadura rubteroloni]